MYRGCLLVLALASVVLSGQGFVPSLPRSTGRTLATRVSAENRPWWGGGSKPAPKKAPDVAALNAKEKRGLKPNPKEQKDMKGNKRPMAMDYRGMIVSKDDDVIVPATEYFANKPDFIVPILFAGLFLPIFGLLGWWLFSPLPEPEMVQPDQKTSYEMYMQKDNTQFKSKLLY